MGCLACLPCLRRRVKLGRRCCWKDEAAPARIRASGHVSRPQEKLMPLAARLPRQAALGKGKGKGEDHTAAPTTVQGRQSRLLMRSRGQTMLCLQASSCGIQPSHPP